MRPLCVSLVCIFSLTAFPVAYSQASAPTHPWTVKEIFGGDDLTGYPPDGISWSPDGKRATYIADNGDVMQIEVADGKLKKLIDHSKIASLLDANISEQDRDHRNRYDEPDYTWSPDSDHLAFRHQRRSFGSTTCIPARASKSAIRKCRAAMTRSFLPTETPFPMCATAISSYRRFTEPRSPLALTSTRDATILNGQIDWVYLEELDVRSNYFWSPDSRQLAYLQMNETHVPLYPITDWIPVHATVDEQRYPQPGDPNPAVRVGVVNAKGGETHWLKIPLDSGNDYIPRFGWVNPSVVWVETLTRDHKHLNIYFADTRTGEVKLALAQTEPKYFTMTYDVKFVGDHQFLIQSWRDGFTHIYRYTFDADNPLAGEAQLANQLESGPYEASKIGTVDEATNTVYYISSEGDPREEQIWAVQLDGTGKRRVTKTPGVHQADFPLKGGSFIDTFSSLLAPPTVSYCTSQGDCTPFWKSHAISGHTLVAPQLLTLTAADGKTTLYGTLQLPVNVTTPASVPLIVNPYGGPGVGAAKNDWGRRGFLFDQLLAEHGFAVLHVDNRGMAGRGRDFEQAAYHNFGPPQLADQLACRRSGAGKVSAA